VVYREKGSVTVSSIMYKNWLVDEVKECNGAKMNGAPSNLDV
jgi:hypothetical protein